MNEARKIRVYLGGMSNHHDNNWKKLFQGMAGCEFYDWEIDSDQTSADTYFPDDLNGIKGADILVANPGSVAPAEATWIEIGYFYALNTKKPGDFCDRLIIIWQESRQPKWSIEFVEKAGFVVSTFDEAITKLKEIVALCLKAN
jgi:hypothetical protein